MRHFIILVISFLLHFTTQAADVNLTMYDDGLSCPGGCDAHVVFAPSMNGTEFAHAVDTKPPSYRKCTIGSQCEICLESGGQQCISVLYRGNGPHSMTFDLTPAFYQVACVDIAAPPLLRSKCQSLRAEAESLAGRTNCIATSGESRCVPIIDSARRAQSQDRVEYEKCVAMGQASYNRSVVPQRRRALDCAYEAVGTGINTKGKAWRKLLPGACRDGTFVGRDGLDCCSGSVLHDGPLARECRLFYPR